MKKLALLVLAPWVLWGHYAWMEPEHFKTPMQAPLKVQIGWGHDFGTHSRLGLERVETLAVDGVALKAIDEYTYEVPFLGEGVHVLEGVRKAAYSTRTPEGRKRLPKNEVKDPIQCGYTINRFFALVGAGEKSFSTGFDGLDVQILTTTWPLVAKQPFMLKTSFKGEPLEIEVVAVYEGYDRKGNENAYPVSQISDAAGLATLEFDRGGKWLIKATHSFSYPDTQLCDTLNYITTVVVEVAP